MRRAAALGLLALLGAAAGCGNGATGDPDPDGGDVPIDVAAWPGDGGAGGGGGTGGGDGAAPGGLPPHSLGVSHPHTCAIGRQGRLSCWGGKAPGAWALPAAVQADVTAVFVGPRYVCASVAGDRPDLCFAPPDEASPAFPMPRDGFSQVAIGQATLCALYPSGQAECGDPAPAGELFSQVSVGRYFACGLRRSGTVTCWGYAGNDASCMGKVAPAAGQLEGPAGELTQITSGELHTCGLRRDGTVACWGAGKTVDPNPLCTARHHYGQALPPAGTFAQLSAGPFHTCGLRRDGTVACWGAGSQPGTCDTDTLNCGQAMPPSGVFAQVAAGYAHTCAMRADRTVQCWGSNTGGKATPPTEFP